MLPSEDEVDEGGVGGGSGILGLAPVNLNESVSVICAGSDRMSVLLTVEDTGGAVAAVVLGGSTGPRLLLLLEVEDRATVAAL